ncbi:hypothetical protein B566_EDAN007069 [Ephemera danica]|nr:hypothetical protein B566_EDAN007069 [Ephemera danica]
MHLQVFTMFSCVQNRYKGRRFTHVFWFLRRCHRKTPNLMTKLLQPMNLIPKDASVKTEEVLSKSQRLMLDLGFIRQTSPGMFCLLPLGNRCLQKLVHVVDREMQAVGGQKILLPTLTSGDLWKSSGRWASSGSELFRLQDRHNQDMVVSPTHEEAVTDLVASLGNLSYRQLPLLLYQVSPKFRDEAKPRSGLLRAREFLMKDLYSFDVSLELAQATYSAIRDAYHRIFSLLGVKYVTVQGDATSMGGSASEEFHMLADVGEDQLTLCSSCGHGFNAELLTESQHCPSCQSSDLQLAKGIEDGSKEQCATENALRLYSALDSVTGLQDNVLIDNRGSLTIGRRFRDANRTGYPFIVIAGKSAVGADPVYEVHETLTGHKCELNSDALIEFIRHRVGQVAVAKTSQS